MDKQDLIKMLPKLFARPVAYHPILAHLFDSVTAALWLSQLIYWSDKGESEQGWIYKKTADWEAELGLTRRQLETARMLVVNSGVVEFGKAGQGNVCHYRIKFDVLADLLCTKTPKRFGGNVQSGLAENAKAVWRKTPKPNGSPSLYTETTTEITTETTCADDHSEYFKPAKKKKTLTGEQLIVKQAMTIFANLARLNESHKWAKDITSQLTACQMDVAKWEDYVKQVLAYMDKINLTYTKPASISWGIERLASGKPLDGRKMAVASQADDDFAADLKRRRELQQ